MKILKIQNFISEKMKVIPISNNELDSVSLDSTVKPIKLLKSGDIVMFNDMTLYRYLTISDFEKYNNVLFKFDTDIISYDNIGDGLFISKVNKSWKWDWMGLVSYNDYLKCNENASYDIIKIARPYDKPDLSKEDSYKNLSIEQDMNIIWNPIGKNIHDDSIEISNEIRKRCINRGDLIIKYNNDVKEPISCFNWDIITTEYDITILWRTGFEIKNKNQKDKIKDMFDELFNRLNLKSKCVIHLYAGYYLNFDQENPEYTWIYNYSYKKFI